MVPRGELEALKQQLGAMITKDELNVCLLELENVRKQLETMVPKAKLDALQDDLIVVQDELERTRRAMANMVSRVKLDSAQDELVKVAGELERLQKQLASTVPKASFDTLQDEVANLGAENERLRKLIDSSVPLAQLERREEDISRLQAQVGLLQQEIADLKSRIDLLLVPLPPIFEFQGHKFDEPFALYVYAPNSDAMVYCTIDGSAPAPENPAALFDRNRLLVNVPAETTSVRAMCVSNGRRSDISAERFIKLDRRERARASAPPLEEAGVGMAFEVSQQNNDGQQVVNFDITVITCLI